MPFDEEFTSGSVDGRLAIQCFEIAADASGVAFWEWFLQEDRSTASKQWEELFGFPISGSNGDKWFEHVHPDDAEPVKQALDSHIKGVTDDFDIEYRFNHPKKEKQIWARSKGKVVERDSEGRALKMVGVSFDITAKKDQIRQVDYERRFTEKLTRLAPAGIYIYDLQTGTNRYANYYITEILGYSKEELNQLSPDDLFLKFHPDDRDKVQEHMDRIRTYGHDSEVEYRYQHKAGHWVWCRSHDTVFEIGESGQVLSYIGICVDITEEKLREAQRHHFQKAMDSSSEAIGMATVDGRHFYQNQAFTDLFGYELGEMPFESPKCCYADKLLAEEVFSEILSGRSWTGELEMRRKDGELFTAYLNADAIRDEDGTVIGIIGIHKDISHEKAAKLDKESELEKLLTIFDATEDIVYVSDPETYELVFTNRKFNDILGFNGSGSSKKCHEVIQNSSVPCDFCTNNIIFNEKPDETHVWDFQNQVNNHWYRCADRAIDWVDGRRLRMEIATDITEEKSNRMALEASEETFRLATEASDNGVWDWWVGSEEVFYSDQWKAQVGYEPDELENSFASWVKLLHPDDKDRMIKSVQDFLENPKPYFIETFRLIHKDGSPRWISNRAAAVLDDDGKVIRMFGAHKDITEQKLTEDQLIVEKKKAETANFYKNHFLANMSHEIRTPMNSVIGLADLLKEADLDHDERKEYLEVIDRNANRLLALIDDIIDVSKIESNELRIVTREYPLNKLLREIEIDFNHFKKVQGKEHISIVAETPEEPDELTVEVDFLRLQQIFTNLINNALKFTREGSIKFGYTVSSNEFRFYVTDTGIGIAEDKQQAVFERFKQVNYSDAARFGGTGLGLAICEGLVNLMGGEMSLESELGKGSTFGFDLALKIVGEHPESTSGKQSAVKSSGAINKKLLIADDDKDVRLYFERLLKPYECELVFAENGREAVDLYKTNPDIDLVMMDIRMPIMNGFEAMEEIITFDSGAQIIAQTAFVMHTERQKCMDLGCINYLTKPLNRDKLLAAIRQ